MVKDDKIEQNDGKVVSLAARQLFEKQIEYRLNSEK